MRVIAFDTLSRILSDVIEDDVLYEEVIGAIRKQIQEAYTWPQIKQALQYEEETWKEIQQQYPDSIAAAIRIREIELLIDVGENLLKRGECGVL